MRLALPKRMRQMIPPGEYDQERFNDFFEKRESGFKVILLRVGTRKAREIRGQRRRNDGGVGNK